MKKLNQGHGSFAVRPLIFILPVFKGRTFRLHEKEEKETCLRKAFEEGTSEKYLLEYFFEKSHRIFGFVLAYCTGQWYYKSVMIVHNLNANN